MISLHRALLSGSVQRKMRSAINIDSPEIFPKERSRGSYVEKLGSLVREGIIIRVERKNFNRLHRIAKCDDIRIKRYDYDL